ncbi:MAG TPA: hypothetical protein VFC78_03140 [Tepidisphaeraceae bacterium]|nr:hypothetical protein [Tepidisphaeraceae bacterium]
MEEKLIPDYANNKRAWAWPWSAARVVVVILAAVIGLAFIYACALFFVVKSGLFDIAG